MPLFPNILKIHMDLSPTDLNIDSPTLEGLSTYQVWSLRGKAFLSYQLHKVWETNMTFDLCPTDLNTVDDLDEEYLDEK